MLFDFLIAKEKVICLTFLGLFIYLPSKSAEVPQFGTIYSQGGNKNLLGLFYFGFFLY